MFRRTRKTADFSAEIDAHLQHEIERLREQGLSDAEARAAARRAFGSVTQAEERFYESGRWLWWDHLRQDLRFGARQLLRNPGFAAVAVVTLALGIAVNATIFSLVSAFLLRRPPVREPDRVVVVSSVNPAPGFQSDATPISTPIFLAWKDEVDAFAGPAAAYEDRTVRLTAANETDVLGAAAVSSTYFLVLGVAPQIGRAFARGEDEPGHDHVVILSHGLWKRRFGADPSILGRTVRLNRENYDVIGVMPADFRLLGFTPDLWTPLVVTDADYTATAHGTRSLLMFGRLKPAATLAQSREEVKTLARRTEDAFPASEKGWGATVRTLPDFLIYNSNFTTGLTVLMTAVGFVLLIACANVAGLLLARAAARRKELAIRRSLGASRLGIVRQLLTESLVIAVVGGCAGLGLTYWGVKFLQAIMTFNDAISAVQIRLDWSVLLFTLGVSLICAVLAGVAPGLSAARLDINTNLKSEGRSASTGRLQSRLRTVMVTGEIALALFLLLGTGLLVRALLLIEHQSLGFHADALLTAGVHLDEARYSDARKEIAFVQEVIGRLKQSAGAEEVAVASGLPATGLGSVTFRIKNEPDLPPGQRTAVDAVISPEYFRTAGIPVLRGRTFTDADDASAPRAVIVNQEFVRRHLGGQDPLATQVALDVRGAASTWSQVVGVVGNVKSYSEDTRDDPEVYEAYLQRPVRSFSFMVRAGAGLNGLASVLRTIVAAMDGELPLSNVMSMQAVIDRQGGGDPVFLLLLASFAFLALILAAIGIYGLVAYSVGQRTHEIGIRVAMGAGRADVLRMILWQGVKMAAIGGAIGLAMALPLPKLFDAMFVGLDVREPRLFVLVPLVLLAVTMAATYMPARRALRIDPITTLRHE